MEGRTWWIQVPANNPLYNFIWKPFSVGINFENIMKTTTRQMINHFEKHKEISQKSHLFMNLQEFAEVIFLS